MRHDRRSFLASLTGLAATGGTALAQPARPEAEKWDLAWLDAFKGKHKQVYDLIFHAPRPNTLSPPTNYFEIHKELSGLAFPDVNVAIGISGSSVAIVSSDQLWATFKLGDRAGVKDPDTGLPAVRNVYLGAPGTPWTVRDLQARGAVFWMCNRSLRGMSADFALELGRPAADVYAELRAGLLPGVKVVPAHTWAIGNVQERGFTYEKL